MIDDEIIGFSFICCRHDCRILFIFLCHPCDCLFIIRIRGEDMSAFLIALFIGLSFGIVAYAVCRFLIWWIDVDGRDEKHDKDDSDKLT